MCCTVTFDLLPAHACWTRECILPKAFGNSFDFGLRRSSCVSYARAEKTRCACHDPLLWPIGGSVAQHGAESLENQMKGRHSRLISPDPACIRAAGGHCLGTLIPVSLVIYRTGNFNERAASCRRPQWTPTFCTGQDCRCTRSASCCLGYPALCSCLGSPTPGHLAGYNPA